MDERIFHKKEKKVKEERDIWPRTLPPARSLMSIAHAVMATIITVMSLMASEAVQEKYVKIIVRFNYDPSVWTQLFVLRALHWLAIKLKEELECWNSHPDARVIMGFCRWLIEEGWPYPATLISIIADIFLLVVVQSAIYNKAMIVLTTLVFLVQFTPLFLTESVKGRAKEKVQHRSHHTIHSCGKMRNNLFPPLFCSIVQTSN